MVTAPLNYRIALADRTPQARFFPFRREAGINENAAVACELHRGLVDRRRVGPSVKWDVGRTAPGLGAGGNMRAQSLREILRYPFSDPTTRLCQSGSDNSFLHARHFRFCRSAHIQHGVARLSHVAWFRTGTRCASPSRQSSFPAGLRWLRRPRHHKARELHACCVQAARYRPGVRRSCRAG